ncbi:MAG: hypothetical protein WDM91_18800 [Rhizomicrobium sp.]
MDTTYIRLVIGASVGFVAVLIAHLGFGLGIEGWLAALIPTATALIASAIGGSGTTGITVAEDTTVASGPPAGAA